MCARVRVRARVLAYPKGRARRRTLTRPTPPGRPAPPSENTARTLTAKHLEEVRAELNRATFCLSGGDGCSEGKSRSSKSNVASWARVCQSPAGKRKLDELKAFLMPVGSTQLSLGRFADVLASTSLSDPVKAVICIFLEHGLPNSKILIDYLCANERRSLHHCCELCGIQSSKVGKAKQGAKNSFRVEIAKPTGWTRPARWANLCLQSTESFNEQADGGGMEVGGGGGGLGTSVLKTVRLLNSGMTLDTLVGHYKLIVRQHPVYPRLVQLSYSQTESSMASDVVQECRGLILEAPSEAASVCMHSSRRGKPQSSHSSLQPPSSSWRVVCMPFRKFVSNT